MPSQALARRASRRHFAGGLAPAAGGVVVSMPLALVAGGGAVLMEPLSPVMPGALAVLPGLGVVTAASSRPQPARNNSAATAANGVALALEKFMSLLLQGSPGT
jgi:hypothetical protein